MQHPSYPKRYYVIALLLLAYYALFFYPVLHSGFYSDDIFLSQGTLGRMLAEDASVWDLIRQDTKQWMGNGRFAPLHYASMYTLFHFANDVWAYKVLLVVFNLAAVASFAGFIYLLQRSKGLVLLTLIVLPVFLQFRVLYHDAYTSFNGLYPCLAILNFGALSCFILYLEKGKGHLLAAVLVLLVGGFCFSEVTLAFMPLYLLATLSVKHDAGRSWLWLMRKLAPVVALAMVYLSLTLWLRANAAERAQYGGLQSSFDAGGMLKVFHAQTFSAIPLSYINYEVNFMREAPSAIWEQMKTYTPVWMLLSLVAILLYLFRKYSVAPRSVERSSHQWLLWAGLCLLLLPAILIMPSVKYQEFSRPGNGYLPVYLQNMGAAVLFALLIHVLFNSPNKVGRYMGRGLALLFLLIVPITFANNCRVVAKQNYRVYYPSAALEKALEDGLMDRVKEHDVIWLADNYHWTETVHYTHLFLEKTGKHLIVVNEAKPEHLGATVYQLSFPPGRPNVVALKRVIGIGAEGARFEERETKTFIYSL